MDLAKLAAELSADPGSAGYATMTDQQAADSLNALTVAAQVDVPVATVMNTLLLRGVWANIELLARDSRTSVEAHDNALAAAIGLIRLCASTPEGMVQMSDATTNAVVKAELAALIAGGAIATADSDAVLALADGKISRAQSVGVVPRGAAITHLDVAKARRG